MDERRLVETFNTHSMADEIVRALATGRDDELTQIIPAIGHAAESPHSPQPALIVYGERGSGKSFLMRLVQMECAAMGGVACVLLPEEQYNIRAPQQLLQVVTAHLRGEDWSEMGWRIDARSEEDAWAEELRTLHAALDARFGAGLGVAVVMVENFDMLVEKLFGAKPPPKAASRGTAVARRQAEERLRKLMNARNGRFMLIASATGTVDMDYERPLFQVFTAIDLRSWSADTAISYFDKRRRLDGLAPLGPAEQARARAIIEFIGGNVRLAQLLGDLLSSLSARTIADTLDELVDKLADYYRQRMEALPSAAAAVLDALIRGGEPVSQTTLGQRLKGEQRQIADAFSYLTRSRLLSAASERGGVSQLYRVRDRLFVHFYRRRYGSASSLAAIAELLEHFFTPEEREQQIRRHLERGEFDDARAFGRLPLAAGAQEQGFSGFQDTGITDGPPREYFELAGVAEADIEGLRRQMRHYPDRAYKHSIDAAQRALSPLRQAASKALAAVAASRNGHDQLAQHVLEEAIDAARKAADADALIVALYAAASFFWWREPDTGKAKALELTGGMAALASRASHSTTRSRALEGAAFSAWHAGRYVESEALARDGLSGPQTPRTRIGLTESLAFALDRQDRCDEALCAWDELLALARQYDARNAQIVALQGRARWLGESGRHVEALASVREAAALATALSLPDERSLALYVTGREHRALDDLAAALDAAREGRKVALDAKPPLWSRAGWCSWLEASVLVDQGTEPERAQAVRAAQEALDCADKSHDDELAFDALDILIYAASLTPQPEALDALGRLLDRDPNLVLGDHYKVRGNWPWAAARAQAWDKALELANRHPALIERSEALWPGPLGVVGQLWVQAAAHDGRAAAYAQASKALPAIRSLLDRRPPDPGLDTDFPLANDLRSLAAPLYERCNDPGVLRDIADLLQQQFGDTASAVVTQLHQFADLHAAPDQQAYLQRIDPDLATAMRRVWNLPEAADTLSGRGRRRAR